MLVVILGKYTNSFCMKKYFLIYFSFLSKKHSLGTIIKGFCKALIYIVFTNVKINFIPTKKYKFQSIFRKK